MSNTETPPAGTIQPEPPASPSGLNPAANGSARARTWLPMAALVLALAALLVCALMWLRLQTAQQDLARRYADNGAALVEARRAVSQAEAVSKDLQTRLGVAEVKLAELGLQRSQLDELMQSVSRTRDDSLMQDLESAIQLAVQQSQLTGSTQVIVNALQAAEKRIARSTQPRLGPVQRAITRDLERIRNASIFDLSALSGRIDELLRQIDELPLANAVAPLADLPLPARPAPARAAAVGKQAAPRSPSVWDRMGNWWDDWSGRIWTALTVRGSELVRVHRLDQPEAALLSPEQGFFLRENTKLKLLNARLALLSQQQEVARSDLHAVEGMMQRYFDLRAKSVATARDAVQQLERDVRQVTLPRPDETLTALKAAGGR